MSAGDPSTTTGPVRRRGSTPLQLAGALVAAAIVCWLAHGLTQPIVGLHQDDGIHVVTARALASGQGYRRIDLPDAPPQVKFPPIFPLALAAAWGMAPAFPGNLPVLLLVPTLAAGAATATLHLLLVRAGSVPPHLALFTAIAAMTMPSMLALSLRAMSEPLFVLWMAIAVSALLAPTAQRWSNTAGTWLGLAILTRTIGLGAAVGTLASTPLRDRRALLAWGPPAAAAVAWFVWTAAAGGLGSAPYEGSYVGYLRTVDAAAWPRIVAENALGVVVGAGALLFQAPLDMLPPAARPMAGFLSGLALLAVLALACLGRARPLAGLLLGYLALTVCWPWPPSRFVAAILPIVLVAIVVAAATFAQTRRIATCIVCLLAAVNVSWAVSVVRDPIRRVSYRLDDGSRARWSDYEALMAAIRRDVPRDAVVASVAESMVFLYTDRRGVFPYQPDTVRLNYAAAPSAGSGADLDRRLASTGARFLARMPGPMWAHADLLDRAIAELRSTAPGRLVSIYRGADSRFELLAVVHGAPR